MLKDAVELSFSYSKSETLLNNFKSYKKIFDDNSPKKKILTKREIYFSIYENLCGFWFSKSLNLNKFLKLKKVVETIFDEEVENSYFTFLFDALRKRDIPIDFERFCIIFEDLSNEIGRSKHLNTLKIKNNLTNYYKNSQ